MKTRVLYSQQEHDNDQELAEAAKKQIDDILRYYSDVLVITDVITLPEVAGIVMNTRHGPITLAEMCTRNELRAVLRALGASPGADPEEVAYIAIKEYRENNARIEDRQILPADELALSVRLLVCLRKMGINTLGDLASTTEKALRDSRNFGDNGIAEIKEVLLAHGFSLAPELPVPLVVENGVKQEDTSTPIGELNLAVRARKAMRKLGVETIEDLVRHTAKDLLVAKNFGVGSINEVREKLAKRGLKLRGD